MSRAGAWYPTGMSANATATGAMSRPGVTELTRRLVAAGVATGCAAVLVVAFFLSPDGSGAGTHEQMGLPACSWITHLDMPCPTCGFTTAFAHAAEGDILGAFATQPMGALLAIATALVCLGGILIVLTGAPVEALVTRYWTVQWTWIVLGLLLVAWVYKMLRFKGFF